MCYCYSLIHSPPYVFPYHLSLNDSLHHLSMFEGDHSGLTDILILIGPTPCIKHIPYSIIIRGMKFLAQYKQFLTDTYRARSKSSRPSFTDVTMSTNISVITVLNGSKGVANIYGAYVPISYKMVKSYKKKTPSYHENRYDEKIHICNSSKLFPE